VTVTYVPRIPAGGGSCRPLAHDGVGEGRESLTPTVPPSSEPQPPLWATSANSLVHFLTGSTRGSHFIRLSLGVFTCKMGISTSPAREVISKVIRWGGAWEPAGGSAGDRAPPRTRGGAGVPTRRLLSLDPLCQDPATRAPQLGSGARARAACQVGRAGRRRAEAGRKSRAERAGDAGSPRETPASVPPPRRAWAARVKASLARSPSGPGCAGPGRGWGWGLGKCGWEFASGTRRELARRMGARLPSTLVPEAIWK
jgi:hypothetical protein